MIADREDIPQQNQMAELQLIHARQDLGSVERGVLLEAKFEIVNSSNDTLRILNINPDCSCTGYRISKTTLAPHQSDTLILTIDTENKIGDNQITATFEANTPQRIHFVSVEFSVPLDTQVPEKIQLGQESLDFGSVPYGERVEIIQEIYNPNWDDIRLLSWESSSPEVSMELSPIIVPAHHSIKNRVYVRPKTSGQYYQKVAITYNKGGNKYMKTFHISGNVYDPKDIE